jgi:soluble lytic murein transglycosylase
VYGNHPTNVKPGSGRTFGLGLSCVVLLGAGGAAAQSRELIEAVRIHAPDLAARAQGELERCTGASDGGVTKPCADHARLSLLTGVLWLSEGEAARAATQLSAVKPPKKLEAFHGWYLGEAQAWSGQRSVAVKTLTKAKTGAPAWLGHRIDLRDRKSTRLNSSHNPASRMPSSA